MIEISGLTKRHGRIAVLHDVTFVARPGRVTGFVGANGAGKSSTLRILLGLDRASAGTATFDGRSYRAIPWPMTEVGAMLDGSGAHPARTAWAHLGWVAASNRIPRRRIGEVLEQVGLADAAKQRTGAFSLGMGQRLGLAAALLGDPHSLVLDEPVNGLDPEGVRWIRSLLRGHAARGGTVLLSSHLMAELAETADDVVVISAGTIRATGALPDIVAGHDTLEDAYFALTGAGAPGAAGGAK